MDIKLDITNKILEGLTDAKFSVTFGPNGIILGLVIKSKNNKNEIPAKIAVPLETPLQAMA